ncbi:MAG: BCD family MFS transporter [Rhodoferax sp.]|nr:BCD family MFS transporter [Rhodoferax sp.]MBJ7468602.1 BCD family MFS transporter [Rhodoferax sp.]
MRANTFAKYAKQMPASWLPFADVSSAGLPLPRLLRLTLFKFTMGMTTALMIGTLNRVMIVELGVPAWLVSLMLALPLVVAPFRAVTGYQSDVHVSAFGWKRVPYMWGGTLIQFIGLAVMPFALLVLSGRGQVQVPDFVGQAAAGIAFLLVGAGLQTSQTAGLALATDQASEETRPRVVALLYTMLLVGAVSGSLIFSVLLSDFTPEKLVQVVQGSAVVVLVLNAIALWKQEPRNPQRAAALKNQVQPKFKEVWAQFIALPQARRFLWATAFGTVAFNMQDIILEPYGGEILKLSVGATSALTAMLAAGGLLGFYVSGRHLAKGADPMRLAAYGALAGLPAFSAVIFSAPLDAGWLFRLGALGIGFGGGLFAVGTLFTAMRMEGQFVGLALGAWGAVQSAAAGIAMFFGGALRDVVSSFTTQGLWGPGMTDPSVSYSMVYHVEMLFLFITLIAIGPLVKRSTVFSPVVPPTLGLAELRT